MDYIFAMIGFIAGLAVMFILLIGRQYHELSPLLYWQLVDDQLPPLDVPVFALTDDGHINILVRTEGDDGWIWCNPYDNVHYNLERQVWETWDAEYDDDYQVIGWHAFPDYPAEMAIELFRQKREERESGLSKSDEGASGSGDHW